jgi:hypothetical protein
MLLIYTLYILAAILVAFIGRNRKFGFWGYFFATLLFTPLIGVILVLASDARPRRAADGAASGSKIA